ncbi:hypothetical protein AOQ84DRAFT_220108 [Glonium stellatum]|uniref:NACHT domain-containing protein n=1 Tax=Glonium stellatum TaxID=574774 RepID=A0A8E2FD41_9PEZI|nr:hypothetical protein AOQ84DRAFT_220108 [Glonium stellatum]
MDPLTALSFAGTIVQFVDFSSKILSLGIELHESSTGTLRMNYELELVVTEIVAIIDRLSQAQDLHPNLQKLCDEAVKVAQQINERLGKLKVSQKKSIRNSLQQAIRAAWAADELAALLARLSTLKETLETSILMALREDVVDLSDKISARFDSLDQQTQRIIEALLKDQNTAKGEVSKGLLEQIGAITRILSRMESNNLNEHRKTRDSLRYIDGIDRETKIISVSTKEENSLRLTVEKIILESLYFERMTARYEEIAEAHQKTFEWIFQPPQTQDPTWYNFATWLSKENGLYWIKGKAGSGKSTLMRYILNHCQTKQCLQEWANGLPLCSASFFFWNSGTLEQKSQHGLLRALLYEVLKQQPQLIPIVLPWAWAKTYSTHATTLSASNKIHWPLARLMEAFELLVQQTLLPLRICLFIDGLDEFEGDNEDHREISELFAKISTSPNVKVCLSSRPWIVFETCFTSFPKLKLQDLTRRDIEYYVKDRVNKNDKFSALAAQNQDAASSLILEISERADGVFLWVKIAVRSLLGGLMNRDSISDLQCRLLELPRDLEKLYDHMFEKIDSIYFEKAARIFQIVRAARICKDHLLYEMGQNKQLSVLALHFAVSSETSLEDVKLCQASDLTTRCEEMEVHLTVHCAGLLEIWSGKDERDKRVNYLHRTGRDFIESPRIWKIIEQKTAGTEFNPNASLLKSCLYQLIAHCDSSNSPLFHHALSRDALSRVDLSRDAVVFAYHANRQQDRSYIALLDQLVCEISNLDASCAIYLLT